MKRPTAFEKIHHRDLLGKLTMADRVLFRGHLFLRVPRQMRAFLSSHGVRLKDFGGYAQAQTAEIKAHAERLAAEAGRPFVYLASSHTARSGYSKSSSRVTSPAATACARA